MAFNHHCRQLPLQVPANRHAPRSLLQLLFSLSIAVNNARPPPGMSTCAIHDNIPAIDSNSRNETEPFSITSDTRAMEYCLCSVVTDMLQSLVLICTPKNVIHSSGEHGPCVFSFGGIPNAVRIAEALRNACEHSAPRIKMSSMYKPATDTPNDLRIFFASALTADAYAGADLRPKATDRSCLYRRFASSLAFVSTPKDPGSRNHCSHGT